MLAIEFRLVCDDVKFFFKSDFKAAGGFIQYFDVFWIKHMFWIFCKCVWIDESFLGFRCSLVLCAKILSALPMYVCLNVSQVSLYTNNDCACFSLMLSLKGNSFPISLGALNATMSST